MPNSLQLSAWFKLSWSVKQPFQDSLEIKFWWLLFQILSPTIIYFKYFLEPFQEYKPDALDIFDLDGSVVVQSLSDKLFLYDPFFEQILVLELLFAPQLLTIYLFEPQKPTLSLASLIDFRFWIHSSLRKSSSLFINEFLEDFNYFLPCVF